MASPQEDNQEDTTEEETEEVQETPTEETAKTNPNRSHGNTPPETSLGETTNTEHVEDDDTQDLETVGKEQDQEDSFSLFDIVVSICRNRYYRAIVKSTFMFMIALKMARECHLMRIPMKEYKPFNRPTYIL